MDRDRASIVILTHNGLGFTRQCIAHLAETVPDDELVIVDNQSTDGTRDYLEELAAENRNVVVIRNRENVGFAKGCNQGVAAASEEMICLLNNDTVTFPGWLDAMMEVFEPGVGAVGARLLYPDYTIQHAGVVFRYVPGIDSYFVPEHRLKNMDGDTPEANVLEDVGAVTAACLLTSRSVWRLVRGMDEGYLQAYYEDIDFNLKVREKRLRIVYQPEAVVLHFENGTTAPLAGTATDPMRNFDANHRLYVDRWNAKLMKGLWRVHPEAEVS